VCVCVCVRGREGEGEGGTEGEKAGKESCTIDLGVEY
jgi:hypothetical protein